MRDSAISCAAAAIPATAARTSSCAASTETAAPAFNDPYDHGDRTWAVAHNHIIENWNAIKDGDVIDVQFILGETKEKKRSEREDYPV
jgi:hypothetical protein